MWLLLARGPRLAVNRELTCYLGLTYEEEHALMRFLVLLASVDHFDNWEASDAEDRDRYFHDYRAFADAVRACGR
jgi:hypothetical protein